MKKNLRSMFIAALALVILLSGCIGTTEAKAATKSDLETAVASYIDSLTDDAKKLQVIDALLAHATSNTNGIVFFGNNIITTESVSIVVGTATYTVYLGDDGDPESLTAGIASMAAKYTEVGGKAADVDDVRSEIDKMTDNFDIKANITDGAASLSGFQPFLEILLGIICYVAIIAMAIFTAFDVCYITMPVFKSKMDEKAMQGGVGTRTTSHGGPGGGEGRKVALVTDDAIQAVEQASQTGKNPLGLYLVKRIIAYVGIAIVLYVLLSGNISLLVNVVLRAIEGFINMLNTLAV